MNDRSRRQSNKESAERRCLAIASRQHGLVTRDQLLSVGIGARSVDRRIASGRLRVVHRSVYRLAGVPESWEQRLLAACLRTHGAASHRSAAALWRLSGFEPNIIEITTSRQVRPAGVVMHRCRLTAKEITSVGQIPVTSVNRTLLDLGAVSARVFVEAALTDALRQGSTTIHKLGRYLGRIGGKGRRGADVLRSILRDLDDRSVQSVLELRLLRLLRKHRLPQPVAQLKIRRDTTVVARVDFAYPLIKLAIEADGYRYHGGNDAWKRDLDRRNALTALGWHVIHVTWADLASRPETVVEQVRDAIQSLSGASLGSEQLSLRWERR